MDIIKQLNNAIAYIEENLCDEIETTARKNGFDSYHAVKMVLSGQINQVFGVGC